MRLWIKIATVCALVLLLIVVGCSAALLFQAQDSLLALATEQVKDKQRSLLNSFSSMADYYMPEDAGEAARYAMEVYCFNKFADETGVLLREGETLVSQAGVLPEALLPLNGDIGLYEQRHYMGVWEGRHLLIAGGRTYVLNSTYSIYVVSDITGVYDQITAMTWRFVLICAAGIAAGVAFITFLVKRALRPLGRLGEVSRQIAGGDYHKRAAVHTHDEVGNLAADFNSMADAVETHVAALTETARRQQLFISGVTHEFKTPMTALLLHSDTLINTKINEEERERSLHHIHDQCSWLERLTQKLLKLITLEEGIIPTHQPVRTLFAAVAASMAETLEKRGTSLIVDCGDELLPMDFDLMRSLLVNLVDNASKASKRGQPVWLSAYGNAIEVRDNGCGIPPDEISRVTEPFYMVDRARGKRHGGVGLGLALAQRIAQAHGAQLDIRSELRHGTSVRVIFETR